MTELEVTKSKGTFGAPANHHTVVTEAIETETASNQTSNDSHHHESTSEPEYDFVSPPDPEYFCPVTADLLLQDPHQTQCCGQHLSPQVANRLIEDGKPCPMCNEEQFNTHPDKFFTRKVRQLIVYCSHKKSGCEWMGELGELNEHTISCSMRPWKCPYCNFQSTYNIGITNHAPQCDYHLVPCPNHCEVGTFPRAHAEKHLLDCPLQLVDCEFASAGCDERVPRKDLARHMTESAQRHLTSTTLLNLRLTKELHQKIERQDQQISELKQKMVDTDRNLCAEIHHLKRQLNPAPTPQYQQPHNKTSPEKLAASRQSTTTGQYRTDSKAQASDFHRVATPSTVTTISVTLKEFSKLQACSRPGTWYSEAITCDGCQFKLGVDTNGTGEARGSHMSAYLYLQPGKNYHRLRWPIKVRVKLELLNQQEQKGHIQLSGLVLFRKPAKTPKECGLVGSLGTNPRSFAFKDFKYNGSRDTEYFCNDSLQFKIMLKIEL